jgi:hypothetical protein
MLYLYPKTKSLQYHQFQPWTRPLQEATFRIQYQPRSTSIVIFIHLQHLYHKIMCRSYKKKAIIFLMTFVHWRHKEREREIDRESMPILHLYKMKRVSQYQSLSSLLGLHILYLIQQHAVLETAVSKQSPIQDQERKPPTSKRTYINISKKRTVSTYFLYITFQSHTKFNFIETQFGDWRCWWRQSSRCLKRRHQVKRSPTYNYKIKRKKELVR